jgi:transcriptional regulator with XRE-family HTH domain
MLAEKLGVRVDRVRDYEKATRPMSPRMLLRLSKVLDVPLSAFFSNYPRRRPLGVIAPGTTTYSREPRPATAVPGAPPARQRRPTLQGAGQERLRRSSASWSGS